MGRPRLLDLFCGAGGAAMGYHRAGFDVVGVDLADQPNYPFPFLRADALQVLESGFWRSFDAIHASPPCQAYSALSSLHPDGDHPRLIGPTRELLEQTGLRYVIENVPGAPLRHPAVLCGSSFGLPIRRHRIFETNWAFLGPPCAHRDQPWIVGVYGASDGAHAPGFKHPGNKRGPRQATTDEAREIMGMPWAKRRREITEAIPPAYTELIGHQLAQALHCLGADTNEEAA